MAFLGVVFLSKTIEKLFYILGDCKLSNNKRCAAWCLCVPKTIPAGNMMIYTAEYDFIDEENGFIRVAKMIDGKSKWGLFNQQGELILPIVYDFIDVPLHDRLFKVFKGIFEWEEFDEATAALFDDLICDPKSWNGDYHEATLMSGCWGLVNEKNEEVIPIKYNSLHFYSDSLLIVNENGSRIIKWYDGDEKQSKWSIVGGTCRLVNLQGETMLEMDSEEEMFDFFTSLNKLQPWDAKYSNQTVSIYFRKKV
jgi:hypothetical protein